MAQYLCWVNNSMVEEVQHLLAWIIRNPDTVENAFGQKGPQQVADCGMVNRPKVDDNTYYMQDRLQYIRRIHKLR